VSSTGDDRLLAGPAALARRFLHVNLNCADIEADQAFYENVAAFSVRMRQSPRPTSGRTLALEGTVVSETRFLYDHRGPRSSTALELLQWHQPAAEGRGYPDPATPGAHATAMAVPSVPRAVNAALAAGGRLAGESPIGLIRPAAGPVAYVLDPSGTGVELMAAQPGEAQGRAGITVGMRISCRDIWASVAWYQATGFHVMSAPEQVMLPAGLFGLGDREPVRVSVARLCLPEDDPAFVVCLVQWADPVSNGTSHPAANHVGLYRMALRVENVAAALAVTRDSGITGRGPIHCPLPGTQIPALDIAFLTDPDGVVVELVERPAAYFRPRRPPTGSLQERVVLPSGVPGRRAASEEFG
jgi:catechol 2,3-dioxygenase-like lactoylglutathione lyase family enzyme